MGNKIIHDLTSVSGVTATDEFAVQKSGESTVKKASVTQVMQVEATARALADDTIEAASGLNANGTFPSMTETWNLRPADFVTGITDRGGSEASMLENLWNAIRILDAKVYTNQMVGKTDIASATFKSPTAANGIYHCFGFYEAPSAHKAFTQNSATQTLGTANNPYGAKVFVVAKEAGAAAGGTGTAKITITGTSIEDDGTRHAGDSAILVADVTALTTNKYVQSAKLWIGQVTLTIAATANHTTFSATCNYGFAAPFHFNESAVQINAFESTGRGGAADTGFNIQLLKHSGEGWIYSAGSFVAGGTVICDLSTDYVTEKNLASGIRFKYFRDELAINIDGTYLGDEGVVVRITTSANAAVDTSDYRIYYQYL